MLIALLSLLVAQSPVANPAGPIFSSPSTSGSLAFFEFAPASGAGMTSACAGTAITGARGETITVSRAGNATCSPHGIATTGITNAALVEVGANLPRVERQSDAVLSLRAESAATNVLTRFIDYTNAVWADVATPTPTAGQTSPWVGTYASSAVLYNDNDAVAFEGRTQTVTVTAATAYTMSCYVKAGTLASWTLSLDGTTASGTGLSSTTWSLVSVTDASSSGVAIAAQILNGSTAAATGTVVWGGCQVEAGSFYTAMQPAVAAAAVRNADVITAAVTNLASNTFCAAATVEPLWGASNVWPNATAVEPSWGGGVFTLVQASGVVATPRTITSAVAVGTFTSGLQRIRGYEDGVNVVIVYGGNTNTIAAGAPGDRLGASVGIGSGVNPALNGLISRIQLDPSPTRCTQ